MRPNEMRWLAVLTTRMKILTLLSTVAALSLPAFAQNEPPAGFTALFNGKDLAGWRGGDTFDHRKLMEMPEDKRAEQLAKWTEDMNKHWKAEGGEMLNDGHGKYATTEKEYGNFELLVDYNMAPKGDSIQYIGGLSIIAPAFRVPALPQGTFTVSSR